MSNRFIFAIKISLIFLFSAVFIFYFFHQARAFILGPQIEVFSLKDGEETKQSFILVKGRVVNAVSLFVNGQGVGFNDTGIFEKNVLLARGYNIIDVSAEDRFGRDVMKELRVVSK